MNDTVRKKAFGKYALGVRATVATVLGMGAYVGLYALFRDAGTADALLVLAAVAILVGPIVLPILGLRTWVVCDIGRRMVRRWIGLFIPMIPISRRRSLQTLSKVTVVRKIDNFGADTHIISYVVNLQGDNDSFRVASFRVQDTRLTPGRPPSGHSGAMALATRMARYLNWELDDQSPQNQRFRSLEVQEEGKYSMTLKWKKRMELNRSYWNERDGEIRSQLAKQNADRSESKSEHDQALEEDAPKGNDR